MSAFSAVDAAVDPGRLLAYLDEVAQGQWGMKNYVAAAHQRHRPSKPVLDIGCGGGHDLALLSAAGLIAVGIDPSAMMLAATAAREGTSGVPLAQARGEALPFADGAFGGCRLERVLLHVEDPPTVVREAVRCLAPGGLLTMFEPDWDGIRVESDVLDERVTWLSGARSPGVGGALWKLAEEHGCDVVDRVEELSVWTFETLERVVGGLDDAIPRAVAAGRINDRDAEVWLAEQRQREAAGRFRATMPKVLIVAQKH